MKFKLRVELDMTLIEGKIPKNRVFLFELLKQELVKHLPVLKDYYIHEQDVYEGGRKKTYTFSCDDVREIEDAPRISKNLRKREETLPSKQRAD